MKMCLKILFLTLFLIVKKDFSSENAFLEKEKIYFAHHSSMLYRVFYQSEDERKYQHKHPLYTTSFSGAQLKKKLKQLARDNRLRDLLYIPYNNYLHFTRKDISLHHPACEKKYPGYHHYIDHSICTCSELLKSSITFSDLPHCGNLAFCLKKCPDFVNNPNVVFLKLAELLDRSYELQRVVRYEDKCNEAYDIYDASIVMIARSSNVSFDEQYVKHIKIYKDSFLKMYINAKMGYLITILKNISLLCLLTICGSNVYEAVDFLGIKTFLGKIFILNSVICSAMFIDTMKETASSWVYGYNFLTACFMVGFYSDKLSSILCYYQGICSIYWIAHASFFLENLYYKYNDFEKAMYNYEKHFETLLILKKEKNKMPVIL